MRRNLPRLLLPGSQVYFSQISIQLADQPKHGPRVSTEWDPDYDNEIGTGTALTRDNVEDVQVRNPEVDLSRAETGPSIIALRRSTTTPLALSG